MNEFRFALPWAFALAPLALGVAWWLGRRRTHGSARLVLPRAARQLRAASSLWVHLERLMPWVRAVALLLLIAALARPQSGAREETVSTHGVDIVVALDNSGSMRAEDFQPLNRLEAAKQTVSDFVDGRPTDRVGLVVFAGLASTRCPLTTDQEMLKRFLGEVTFPPPEFDKTALGMGLATAANRLRDSNAKSKVVVLVTDGRNNAGEVAPEAAAAAAKTLGIRVHTIGVGTEGKAPIPVQAGPYGQRYTWQQLDLDEELLQAVAAATGGEYFRATDAESLRQVFELINEMEQTEIESRERVIYSEMFPLLLLPAAVMLLLEGTLSSTRLRRIP